MSYYLSPLIFNSFSFDIATRNPKPCPLLHVLEAGEYSLGDIDIRTDLPRYRVFADGALTDEVTDISSLWRKDLVTFVIGCSFSFEEALQGAGLRVRHIEMQRNVPMYATVLIHGLQLLYIIYHCALLLFSSVQVQHQYTLRESGAFLRQSSGQHAAIYRERRIACCRNFQSLSKGARCANSYRRSGEEPIILAL